MSSIDPYLPLDSVSSRRVSIYITRDVAFDLDKMNQVTKKILGKLGCDACHSGRILDYHIIENFVVNPKTLDITDMPGGIRF